MKNDQNFETQKRQIYRRMCVGSFLGGSIFFAGGLGLAWLGDNMNPVAGLGVLVLATIGVVIGALLGTLTKSQNQEQRENK